MADWSYCEYRIAGEPEELDRLFGIMRKVENAESGPWLWALMAEINGEEAEDARGQWSELKREDDCISFVFEGAGRTYIEEWDEVCDNFETLCPYFEGVLWAYELAQKRENPEKGWFPNKYYLDMRYSEDEDDETGSFRTLEDVYKRIEELTGTQVSSEEDVEALRSALEEKNDDTFILIYEIEDIQKCESCDFFQCDREAEGDSVICRVAALMNTPQRKKLIKTRCCNGKCQIQTSVNISVGEHRLPLQKVWLAIDDLSPDEAARLIHSIEEETQHD